MSNAVNEFVQLPDAATALRSGGLARWLYLRRLKKAKRQHFIPRWEAALKTLWAQFVERPVTHENLDWFQRKHDRLMRVADRHISPNKAISQPATHEPS